MVSDSFGQAIRLRLFGVNTQAVITVNLKSSVARHTHLRHGLFYAE